MPLTFGSTAIVPLTITRGARDAGTTQAPQWRVHPNRDGISRLQMTTLGYLFVSASGGFEFFTRGTAL